MATTKDWQHRICLGQGIFAEVTLRFQKGSCRPWEWTYPDYRSQEYISIFNRIRRIYRDQLHEGDKKNMTCKSSGAKGSTRPRSSSQASIRGSHDAHEVLVTI